MSDKMKRKPEPMDSSKNEAQYNNPSVGSEDFGKPDQAKTKKLMAAMLKKLK